jgi:hypothetical protein
MCSCAKCFALNVNVSKAAADGELMVHVPCFVASHYSPYWSKVEVILRSAARTEMLLQIIIKTVLLFDYL